MTARFGRTALIYGGDSPEREISERSARMVGRELDALCEEVVRFDPAATPLAQLAALEVERAFIVCHGGAGEDGRLQAALEVMGIPFTGSRHLACALAMDKGLSKLVWMQAGLPTSPWLIAEDTREETVIEIQLALGTDVFVKPVAGGSSKASRRAEDTEQLVAAIASVLATDSPALVETNLEGMEVTYPVLRDRILPGIRIEVAGGFYDYAAKYELESTQMICPTTLREDIDQRAQQIAMEAYQALGCAGWGRVDLFVTGMDIQLLEINTVPGMTDHSLVPHSAAVAGIGQTELVASILEDAR